MLRRQLWQELSPRFPLEHWDHWMRLASTARGRECVVPRVSRNFNIGVRGANMDSAQYTRYLKRIRRNTRADVRLRGLARLVAPAYERDMALLVERAAARPLPLSTAPTSLPADANGSYLYTYTA